MAFEDGTGNPREGDTTLASLREAYHERLSRPGDPFQIASAFPLPADLPALYTQLSTLRACLDSFRPLDPAQAENLRTALDIEYTYNSNRIEGNSLTLRETAMIVNDGFTIAGKSMREHLEATNHQEAIAVIRELAEHQADLTPASVRRIHALIMHGIDRDGGRYRTEGVFIKGSQHVPPNPLRVPELMSAMYDFYAANAASLHPVQLAAEIHEKLATIHPFTDGNGRTARLIMNLILLRAGYPITIISAEANQRQAYYDSLEAANLSPTGDNAVFQRFIAENVRLWLLRYLDMVSVDVSEQGKSKGLTFFQAIAPFIDGHARP